MVPNRFPLSPGPALWLIGLLVAASILLWRGELVTDLQGFTPEPVTETGIALDPGGGPAGQVLLLGIEGGNSQARADASDHLVQALRDHPAVAEIRNGRLDPDDPALDFLLEHRYLLSPEVTPERFSVDTLRDRLGERREDLSSAAPLMPRELIGRDPTGESLVVLEQLGQAGGGGERDSHGVWVDPERDRALLVLHSAAEGMDLDGQESLLKALDEAFADYTDDLDLLVAGPAVIAVESRGRIRGEITTFSLAASLALATLLLVVFRHPHPVWLAAVPLATGILAGAAVVTVVFGHLHGIALAFGITVLGIALDYPLHLFAHSRQPPSDGMRGVARELWPAIGLGAGSTVLVYALMAITGFSGMAQLGLFVLTGVGVAAITTRWVLPRLMPQALQRDGAPPARLPVPSALTQPPVTARWILAASVLGALVVIASADPFPWEDNLGALHPVPQEHIDRDRELRHALGLPDIRHALLITAPDPERALQAAEALTPGLEDLRNQGALTAYDHAAQALPSQALQRARQGSLPATDTLRERLDTAVNGLGFRADAFEPFLEDVARTRDLEPLTPATLPEGPLRQTTGTLLMPDEARGDWMAWVRLSGVEDATAVRQWLQREPLTDLPALADVGVQHVDFLRASEDLVSGFRDQALERLALGVVAVTLLLLLVTRAPGRSLRILTAVGSGLVLTVAALILLGIPLSLFHLIALLLIVGLCLDYAVFFSRPLRDLKARQNTAASVSICALSTVAVFGLLALSSLPVLRAMGLTVVLGVVFSFLAAALLAQPPLSRRTVGTNNP
ncbi:MMPL family transporter [Thioalkalivibrio sp. ALJ15]|uniref:MMPL family transporter n=1 Tax=Thioalkalivibrio sp. ALJ15 TaxID=748652 RepID=UPI000365F731|nr:MMPL family transporter [Thioalkalivibrio sp. ALJ15]